MERRSIKSPLVLGVFLAASVLFFSPSGQAQTFGEEPEIAVPSGPSIPLEIHYSLEELGDLDELFSIDPEMECGNDMFCGAEVSPEDQLWMKISTLENYFEAPGGQRSMAHHRMENDYPPILDEINRQRSNEFIGLDRLSALDEAERLIEEAKNHNYSMHILMTRISEILTQSKMALTMGNIEQATATFLSVRNVVVDFMVKAGEERAAGEAALIIVNNEDF